MNKYPSWICADCGKQYGRIIPDHVATFHEPDKGDPADVCGWCGGKEKSLTEPRDFGYPEIARAT